jgi:hypothetical protein
MVVCVGGAVEYGLVALLLVSANGELLHVLSPREKMALLSSKRF